MAPELGPNFYSFVSPLPDLHRQHTETIDTNDRRFSPTEFAGLLGKALGGTVEAEGGAISTLRGDWVRFGRRHKPLFRRPPPVSFMLGAFDPTEAAERESGLRATARQRAAQEGAQRAAAMKGPATK